MEIFGIIKASDQEETPFNFQEQGAANVPILVAMEIMENVNYCKYVAPGWQEASGSGESAGVVPFMHAGCSSLTICVPGLASTISTFIHLFSCYPAVLLNVAGAR